MPRLMRVLAEEGGNGFVVNPEHIRVAKRDGNAITIDVGGVIGYIMTSEMTLEEFSEWWAESLSADDDLKLDT